MIARQLCGLVAQSRACLEADCLSPSFARGSRLQTTPKGRKEQTTCQGPPGQPERTSCAVKRMAIKGLPLPSPLGRTATRGVCKDQEERVGEREEDECKSCEPLTTNVIPQESGGKKDAGSSRNSSTNQAAPEPVLPRFGSRPEANTSGKTNRTTGGTSTAKRVPRDNPLD